MINIVDKFKCCGCSACLNICPNHAITMKSDSEGFLYPIIDESKCIKCGLCVDVCPLKLDRKENDLLEVYSAKNKNIKEQKNSSSGGMFPIFANYVLSKGGVVFGAGFNDKWEVVHQYIEDKKDLYKLTKSKYVQSDIGLTFKQAEEFLKKDRLVLFTETPCQIEGLKGYLRNNYENLLTVDLVCFQVGSPKVWQKCLVEEIDVNNIKSIDFRDKIISWDKNIMRIYLKNNSFYPKFPFIYELFPKKIKFFLLTNYFFSYMKGYLRGLFSRPSCHNCNFKGKRNSDFTIGDLWGIYEVLPKMYDKHGVSVLTINSQKAKKLFEELKNFMEYSKISFSGMVKHNPAFVVSAQPHLNREIFFERYENEKLKKLIPELLKEKSIIVRIFNKIYSKFICL